LYLASAPPVGLSPLDLAAVTARQAPAGDGNSTVVGEQPASDPRGRGSGARWQHHGLRPCIAALALQRRRGWACGGRRQSSDLARLENASTNS
ncbi:unnamed protein product, partial [Urochloa humidicola]